MNFTWSSRLSVELRLPPLLRHDLRNRQVLEPGQDGQGIDALRFELGGALADKLLDVGARHKRPARSAQDQCLGGLAPQGAVGLDGGLETRLVKGVDQGLGVDGVGDGPAHFRLVKGLGALLEGNVADAHRRKVIGYNIGIRLCRRVVGLRQVGLVHPTSDKLGQARRVVGDRAEDQAVKLGPIAPPVGVGFEHDLMDQAELGIHFANGECAGDIGDIST